MAVETLLKQVEAQIASMEPGDREEAARALAVVFRVLGKYKMRITAGAFLSFVTSLGIAQGTDGMERFKLRTKATANKIGSYVGAVFQAW